MCPIVIIEIIAQIILANDKILLERDFYLCNEMICADKHVRRSEDKYV